MTHRIDVTAQNRSFFKSGFYQPPTPPVSKPPTPSPVYRPIVINNTPPVRHVPPAPPKTIPSQYLATAPVKNPDPKSIPAYVPDKIPPKKDLGIYFGEETVTGKLGNHVLEGGIVGGLTGGPSGIVVGMVKAGVTGKSPLDNPDPLDFIPQRVP